MATSAGTGQATAERREESTCLLSVVIPCLNEAENVEQCVTGAFAAMAAKGIAGEVVVADNGSDDGSAGLAELAGATVVHEPRRGYGSAYMAGFGAARGAYILMADADLTYDFNEIPRFFAALQNGADMAIGDRMQNIKPGAMPWHHRYIGNPLLSRLLNFLFHTGVNDAHCGMRAFRREHLERLDLHTIGMEFASEMVVRAAKAGLNIEQLPIEYHPRGGESKLSSFRDGWRHVRYLMMHSPKHLFIAPGTLMAALGALICAMVLAHVDVLGRRWEVHTLIGGSLLVIVGTQVVTLGLCARTYGIWFMGERDPWFERQYRRYRLEHGLMLGGGIAAVGLAIVVGIVLEWVRLGFGSLSEERLAIVAATLLVLGIQVVFASFLLSILGLRRR
ncbi:MAG TPA: glycosyltransferase family 2 protein [Solirubrobacteraceae bacterium]|jgi:glycosyltransferase involved in cell wall biosynthesis|nr:glycosyltransferase family 2 protein [Solirubrobacteraceae bacterium]